MNSANSRQNEDIRLSTVLYECRHASLYRIIARDTLAVGVSRTPVRRSTDDRPGPDHDRENAQQGAAQPRYALEAVGAVDDLYVVRSRASGQVVWAGPWHGAQDVLHALNRHLEPSAGQPTLGNSLE